MAVHDADRWWLTACSEFREVVDLANELGFAAVGVDMPIGLPDDGVHPAEPAMRALLGHRRSTLFPAPAASVLDASDYQGALALSRRAAGKGLSKQAFNLLPSIRQVRSAVDATDQRFREVHPETTFAVLAGAPLPPKRTAAGVGRRIAVLDLYCSDVAATLSTAPDGCGVDDALDAMAAAVSARRLLTGDARVLGSGVDSAGYSLTVVA